MSAVVAICQQASYLGQDNFTLTWWHHRTVWWHEYMCDVTGIECLSRKASYLDKYNFSLDDLWIMKSQTYMRCNRYSLLVKTSFLSWPRQVDLDMMTSQSCMMPWICVMSLVLNVCQEKLHVLTNIISVLIAFAQWSIKHICDVSGSRYLSTSFLSWPKQFDLDMMTSQSCMMPWICVMSLVLNVCQEKLHTLTNLISVLITFAIMKSQTYMRCSSSRYSSWEAYYLCQDNLTLTWWHHRTVRWHEYMWRHWYWMFVKKSFTSWPIYTWRNWRG
jgi:hypothetical protein